MDIHLKRMADVLVNYSTSVKPGDWVLLMSDGDAEPLLKELYAATLAAGGNPSLLAHPDWSEYLVLKQGTDAQLDRIDPLLEFATERVDVRIRVLAERNTKPLSNIPLVRQQRRAQATGRIAKTQMERGASGSLRWCLTLFPTEAYAQEAEMSLEEYEAFVYGAGLLDDPNPVARWREISARQQRLVEWLKGRRELRITGANADLQLSIRERVFMNSDGKRNFPSGEIFTGPVEQSTNGWVRFTYPASVNGREVTDIELRFENGRVVNASASKNQDALLTLLDTDAGARYLGELGIGTNPGITRFTHNTLFDEKIQGTFHLALGRSYPETGGQNQSAIHKDLVCDLHEGEIVVDGELFYRNGDFAM